MTITKHAALLLMTLIGLAGLLNAQSATVTAQVPFDFIANGKTMPAGECTIAVQVNGRALLSINSGNQHNFAFSVDDESASAKTESALVFHRYGGRYFLVAIKHDGKAGYKLPASKLERELQARNVPGEALTLLASAK